MAKQKPQDEANMPNPREDVPFQTDENIPVEMKDGQGLPVTRKKRIVRNLVSGADFHDFNEEPVFVGRYRGPVIREKDGPNVATNPNEKAGTVMGYKFTELLDFDLPTEKEGHDSIVGNSDQIKRGLEKAKDGEIYKIEFLGKTENSKKQPVNRFRVDLIEEQ